MRALSELHPSSAQRWLLGLIVAALLAAPTFFAAAAFSLIGPSTRAALVGSAPSAPDDATGPTAAAPPAVSGGSDDRGFVRLSTVEEAGAAGAPADRAPIFEPRASSFGLTRPR